MYREDIGWRGRIRTFNPLIQSQVPYGWASSKRWMRSIRVRCSCRPQGSCPARFDQQIGRHRTETLDLDRLALLEFAPVAQEITRRLRHLDPAGDPEDCIRDAVLTVSPQRSNRIRW